ncbi:zinc finger 492-like [Octopus vulgaris]|uniref:Zinc finger 492-like n=1 Tax=Octopus vulgaris TaxID=6645 RepID=A0AA36AIB8_OCTVU|nr:zinc finger 492-like [Octopus vulgaris]
MENELRTRLLKQQRKPYYCDIFSKPFSESGNWTIYKHSHIGEISYHCDVFATHKLTYWRKILYHCVISGKSFFSMAFSSSHKHIHTDEKPYH